jgi:hypothetical protein
MLPHSNHYTTDAVGFKSKIWTYNMFLLCHCIIQCTEGGIPAFWIKMLFEHIICLVYHGPIVQW